MHPNAAVILELARIADACARVHEEGAGNLRRLGNETLARVHEAAARDMRDVARKRKRTANSPRSSPGNDTPPEAA